MAAKKVPRVRQLFCKVQACLLVVLLAGTALARADTLRVLAWPGYADADLVKVFEQRTGSKVEVTEVDSDATLWTQISREHGGDFDVFAVNTAELQRYIAAKLVVPIQMSSLPNVAAQLPRFRDLKSIPGLVHDGQVFAIPYTYSEMGLIYDRSQFKQPPDSITSLWDPRYQGKVLLYNGGTHNFSLAAQSLGVANPFHISPDGWKPAVEQLIRLRRNALAFYTQPEESVSLFVRHRAALMFANYGMQQVKLLRAAGVDTGYVIPKEGALAWLDCWAVTRGAHNLALAQAWINYMLEPAPSEALVTRQGLANTTSVEPGRADSDHLLWLEPLENPERRDELWQRIVSGDRAAKVWAP
jgi:putative spermidine/putrescine transport system substrate-binding protein